MAHYVYILYSEKLNRYYIGETEDFKARLKQHNESFYEKSYTSAAPDWKEYLIIDCESKNIARKLEAFIKRTKSRKFIERLQKDEIFLRSVCEKISRGS